MNYTVTWVINIESDNEHEAARKALEIQQDINSIATVFTVINDCSNQAFIIDLGDYL